LSSSWMAWSWAAVCWDRSVPLGRYSRSRPLVFSLEPRCQGAWDQRVDLDPGLLVMRAWRAISLPLSQVRVRANQAGYSAAG